jgi:hypothetical protein
VKFSNAGYMAGCLVGVHGLLAFTFIARPGTWMFASLPAGQAIAAYGYLAMLWLALCMAAGALAPSAWRRLASAIARNDR